MAAKTKISKGKVAAGVGVAAAALAAGAAAYYFSGRNGAKSRAKAKKWVSDAKREVVSELRKLKTLNKGAYDRTVEAVAGRYRKLKDVAPGELAALTREMKGHWGNVSKAFSARKPARRPAAKKK